MIQLYRLYQQASEDIKEVHHLLTNFKKSNFDIELANITDELVLLEGSQKEFKKDERALKKQVRQAIEEIKSETKRLKPVDNSVRDINTINLEKENLT